MLTFRLKEKLIVPLEAEAINVDKVAQCSSLAEIKKLPVFYGRDRIELGDVFEIEGSIEDGKILIEGDLAKVKGIAKNMSWGEIEIHGNVGMHLAEGLRGGKVIVRGNVSDWLGMNMSGGVIYVDGNAGNFACASYWGEKRGMTGGVVIIKGNVGNDLGRRMRRGTILVMGDAADFAGSGVIAGTIFILGKVGKAVGAEMKRGTIVLLEEAELLPSFRYSGEFKPLFIYLYVSYFERNFGLGFPEKMKDAYFKRFMGDFLQLGKGEILICSC
ncbi:MAG: formylmethanofuran dehydrogenase subunit C [Synergistetes bacterium]|nr:MAG: Putative GXGXG motif protein [bacterium 42_11]MBC7332266.1 formylmethanofuran dehydrogenase subunit C [Synergistota bacterium]MDK2870964.1 formylmethanofuran dehydrogenase subunit [bacterium]